MTRRQFIKRVFLANAFHEKLNLFMEQYDMSYRAMADMAELSLNQVFRIAHGREPSIRAFVALCTAMEIDPATFIVKAD